MCRPKGRRYVQIRALPITPHGHFLRVNPAWKSTLGYTRDELKAKRFFDFVNPDAVGATRKVTITKMSRL